MVATYATKALICLMRLIYTSALTASAITSQQRVPTSLQQSLAYRVPQISLGRNMLVHATLLDVWSPESGSNGGSERQLPGRSRRRSIESTLFAVTDGRRYKSNSARTLDASTAVSGVRSWNQEYSQNKYHNQKLPLKVDEDKLRKYEQGRLGRVDSRDMERVLARGNGKSPGAPPHFRRIAAAAVEAAKTIAAELGHDAEPLTVNVVLHEWLGNRLTHHLAERADSGREITVFVGNELFVDNDLLLRRGHLLIPTGGSRKASLPQTVACMATVALARALTWSRDRLPRDAGCVPRRAVAAVAASSNVSANAQQRDGDDGGDPSATNELVVNMIADTVAVEGVMAACLSVVKAVTGASIALWQFKGEWDSSLELMKAEAVNEGDDAGGYHGQTLVERIGLLVEAVDVPDLPRENKEDFLFAAKRYREELHRGGEPLLMDTEGAGTQSGRRRPPFYSYHKLKAGTLLVSVASEPGVLRGLRARSGGIGAADPTECLVLEATPGPNSADSVLAVLATEAFLTTSINNDRVEKDENIDVIGKGVDKDNSPVGTTVLVGRDGVLQDLVEIANFNGVKMTRILDLPHERVRPRPRGRGIPRANRLKKSNRGVVRVPLGRRS